MELAPELIPGPSLAESVVLVTGSSRGIGAETVRILANKGAHVIVNYREKAKRAQKIVDDITAQGGKATLLGADITDEESVSNLVADIKKTFGKLDILVLNASGGLEMGKSADYPMQVNRDAQLNLVKQLLPIMSEGGRIVFITSHQAHFLNKKPVPQDYIPIAESKRAGEDALREYLATENKVSFVVVSGDMIDGTIIVTLLARRDPEAVQQRKDSSGSLPTVEEFAAAIAQAAIEPATHGHTIYVGGADYLTN